ncbi:hypothetical protein MKW94_004041 [Papaver nudicaule]|uniref:Uncharacterized protein n=1 Tax=Papaver nudicaule TaxID=74823 RepID=A0AA41S856_PAPNU|nr:hypothetical protein [Papaver nudicaule]MCL7036079.1 hypothetical protein [Papaver nudicaule]
MAKNALVFSPFFFGLLFLALIAFSSEQGGGVSGQSCTPVTGSPFAFDYRVQQNSCDGCDWFCKSRAVSGVKSGLCSQLVTRASVSQYLCLCCVVLLEEESNE